ncbi:MAG: pyridoxamine 5'-phosphate oxidase family protein [Actinomycetota bacterium]|nr:pyridoxamine 5'-phosphate oxidase family protein [Actinomycetota bacterium]
MSDWAHLEKLATGDGFAVITVIDDDGRPHASVVTARPFPHPTSGARTVAFVVRGGARKLAHLRARPWASITFRVGHDWISANGPVELAGPDDPHEGLAGGVADVPALLRDVFVAAGGTHDDWDEFDRVMVAERRTAVLITPSRFLANR